MRYDAHKIKDLASNPEAQRALALWAIEATGHKVLVDLYRSRPRATEGGTTRLLGQRGPTGRIISGEGRSIRASFDRRRLKKWAEAWLAAHGATEQTPDPAEAEFVTKYLLKYGLPADYHSLLSEEV